MLVHPISSFRWSFVSLSIFAASQVPPEDLSSELTRLENASAPIREMAWLHRVRRQAQAREDAGTSAALYEIAIDSTTSTPLDRRRQVKQDRYLPSFGLACVDQAIKLLLHSSLVSFKINHIETRAALINHTNELLLPLAKN